MDQAQPPPQFRPQDGRSVRGPGTRESRLTLRPGPCSGAKIEIENVDRRDFTYLYNDGEGFVFMDVADYDQITVGAATVGDAANFLLENQQVQIALNPPEERAAATVGLTMSTNKSAPQIWTCPSRPGFPTYEAEYPQWAIGFQYFGGITNWMNPAGTFPSRSPVKTSTSGPGWVLAADATMKIDGRWGGGRDTAFKGMPPHKAASGIPAGGNHVHVDGSARWIRFEKMLFLHSWNTGGSRDAYFYQEDIGPELERQLARLRPRP